ncbi:HHR199Cp [Eremothecium sinecaudum]|uniref:Glucosidase 2 subunit beta n=1 Tax=Eremothecium sinecaudum TaxID=45286 RepID=A0A109V0W8_9SACH|nr:HHR199Cp [Eremothecium sinecaudum]AMD22968.1 HHR199Cp [Eremothecium sinecaudum]
MKLDQYYKPSSVICLLVLAFGTMATKLAVRGVSPPDQHLYEPIPGDPTHWHCLNDSSIVLNIDQINDDYCDCPDGSDEPGTSACGGRTRFYCENKGFISKTIEGYKVSDGICDCCDCSDEYEREPWMRGATCEALAEDYKAMMKEELSNVEEGVRIMRSITSFNGSVDKDEEISRLNNSLLSFDEQIEKHGLLLTDVEELYRSKLETSDPVIAKFKNLNVEGLVTSIDEIFSSHSRLSAAYQDLRQIMLTLATHYNSQLKNTDVNANINKFENYMENHGQEHSFSSSLDDLQHQQLKDYFKDELFATFVNKQTDAKAKDIIGKYHVARAMLLSKYETKDELLKALHYLQGLMDNIKASQTAGIRDPAVNIAIESYDNYLHKYEGSLNNVEKPKDLFDNLTQIGHLVIKEAPSIENPDQHPGSDIWGILAPLKQMFFHSNNDPLKEQIDSLKSTIEKLTDERNSAMTRLQKLRREVEIANESSGQLSILKNQILKFGEHLDDSCITKKLDEFEYSVCPVLERGTIIQTSDESYERVLIGSYSSFHTDVPAANEYYLQHLRANYRHDNLISNLLNASSTTPQPDVIGNLMDVHNGLVLTFKNGKPCWNGPRRSATVHFLCGNESKIITVNELSRCTYTVLLSSPLGCNLNFNYKAPPLNL